MINQSINETFNYGNLTLSAKLSEVSAAGVQLNLYDFISNFCLALDSKILSLSLWAILLLMLSEMEYKDKFFDNIRDTIRNVCKSVVWMIIAFIACIGMMQTKIGLGSKALLAVIVLMLIYYLITNIRRLIDGYNRNRRGDRGR